LGEQVSMPILVAPMAFQAVAHSGGEIATTKAAGAAETLMILSTLATISIEEALEVASGPVWFRLYVFKDREITASLVQRAEAAGCKAIVMTLDVPLLVKPGLGSSWRCCGKSSISPWGWRAVRALPTSAETSSAPWVADVD
jgi:isopentenyl diphosphate isomerase/L-lactate dehydrogenase-like FMN-dependent dehydrogenase